MLTNKDYCDYDTCVALKKLGYTEKTLAYYTSEKFFHWNRAYIYDVSIPDLARSDNKKGYKHIVDAVSLWDAQKWLMENHNLHVEVSYNPILSWYVYRVWKHQDEIAEGEAFPSYEDALSTAIYMAVEYLKEE